MRTHRSLMMLATSAMLVGTMIGSRPASAAATNSLSRDHAAYARMARASAATPLTRTFAALPPTATVSDATGDVSSCQGDIVSAGLDFSQATSVVVRVETACASDPNTDVHWTAGSSLTAIGAFFDVNGDGDEEYFAGATSPPRGGTPIVGVFHTANGDFTQTCTGALGWDGSTGFSMTLPASCLGNPAQVQAWTAMTWDDNPLGDTCTCDDDYAPDQGWIGPVAAPAPAPPAPPPSPPAPPPATPQGYWLVASDGGIFSFGNAAFLGSTGNLRLNKPIVGMASAKGGQGYWFVASDGGVFSFGNAPFLGSTGSMVLNKPIVGMAATPDGGGYWLVASDGGIFSFGDAKFFGSTGALHLNKPIVGMATTDDGMGYWLVASDGGIFNFGDAAFFGSAGNLALARPIVGMALAGSGRGYWLAAADGAVLSYGPDATFYGSGFGRAPTPVVGISASPDRLGYRLVTSDGRVEAFGDAQHVGDMTGHVLALPVVGMATPA